MSGRARNAEHPGTDDGTWIVVPTYNEAENLRPLIRALFEAAPNVRVLIVDDGSPDGTGQLADDIAVADPRVCVLHRSTKEGLGRAYLAGFQAALDEGATAIVQMDADFSHDPSVLPTLIAPVLAGSADLVIGSRYVSGGGAVGWGLGRRIISRAGSLFARVVLGLPIRDLTGGYKVWNAAQLRSMDLAGVRAGGYVFQIEMTYRAQRSGALIVELPITFRDRTVGVSKMSRRIVVEALLVVVDLRIAELRGTPRKAAVDQATDRSEPRRDVARDLLDATTRIPSEADALLGKG